MRVKRFEHCDAQSLKKPQRLDSGFLRVEGFVARVGIQEYRDSTGRSHRELRLPEEVFDQKSLDSFRQLPVTNCHPPVMLNASNAKTYSVGNVGDNVRKDGDFVAANLMITDQEAIESIERGRSQLSNGYSCTLDATQDEDLVKKWGPYDYIQRDIVGNHIAIVDAARAGPKACLRLDGSDAETGSRLADFGSDQKPVLPSELHKEPRKMIKMKIDGLEIEVADENAKSIIERAIENSRKAGESEKTRADGFQKEASTLQDAVSKLQAKYDSLEAKQKSDEGKTVKCDECSGSGKMDGKDCSNCAGAGTVKMDHLLDEQKRKDSFSRAVARGVAARTKLELEARKHLGMNEKLDDKSDLEIKKLVIQQLDKTAKFDGKNDLYVETRYEIETEKVRNDHQIVTGAAPPPPKTEEERKDAPTDPNAARNGMIQRMLAGNQKR